MIICLFAVFVAAACGDELLMPDASPDRVQTPICLPFKYLGTIRPRAASEIKASNWTVGCEGLDRDFDDFTKFRHVIEPLGIKTIRLQAGWAKTEKVPGTLDFAWLDEIVDYAAGHGINVLLETDYGNPAYPGGGGMYLGASFPTNEIALAAWDHWVDELSKRYRSVRPSRAAARRPRRSPRRTCARPASSSGTSPTPASARSRSRRTRRSSSKPASRRWAKT